MVLKDQADEEENEGSVVTVRKRIMKMMEYGSDTEACPLQNLLKVDEKDSEWIACVVKRASGLFREDLEHADHEELVEVYDDRPVDL